ncbi:hypothetical protein BJ508DRAFT_30569 [Ascobolus immersus RN42]|uniref:Uncharacterized protein n=1 Tax=Ascobolus immersus RN42 TaxID=1160509 RepID=A0A3N4HQE2_ASCIM|nr:hypothetical protein BJ508DRAFT_30569 [Ascobolus immersus RN42]
MGIRFPLVALAFVAYCGFTSGSPVAKAQLSLPPLIPAIPGVSDLINNLSPALPILRVPTPPLASPPFTPSTLKPKKIGYFWTGSNDKQHKDFLATYSLDDDTFGTLIDITDVPSSGNEPHHLGISADGKTLLGGGLLSLLKTQDTAYFFDITDPYRPKFKKSNRALLASIADEIRAKPDGGFFMTYMGSAAGTNLGRLVEFDKNFDIIGQYPEDVAGNLNILKDQFSPHGLTIDYGKKIGLTSDYVVPLSTLHPSLGIQRANTLRLWNIDKRTIISTITIPNGGGIQDVKFIPGNRETAAIATAVHLGQVWIIYPFRIDDNGNQGTAELLYDFGERFRDATAIYSDLTEDGKYAYFTITTANHIAALDISDLSNPKRLDDPNETQPVVGPHFLRVTPDQKHLIVCDYFVQQDDIGLINTAADYKVHQLNINEDGSLTFSKFIDFVQPFSKRGGARPHSTVILDVSDGGRKFNPY